MSEKPLHEYIDLEAYDVVTGQQYRELRDAAERVVAADNQSLGAIGEEGHRAQVEIIDALHALRVLLLELNPAKEQP